MDQKKKRLVESKQATISNHIIIKIMFATIVLVVIISPIIWWLFFSSKFKSLQKVPGPKRLPFLGNITDIGRSPQERLRNLHKFNTQYNGFFRIDTLGEVRLFIAKPELVEQVLTSNVHLKKSSTYVLLQPWLGVGLLTSAGQKWKARRKMITPTFHFKILDEFLDIFNSCSNVLLEKLSEEVGKDSVDVRPLMHHYTLDVICESAMGYRIEAQEGRNSDYVDAVRGYLEILQHRTFSWEKLSLVFRLSPKYSINNRFINILHKFTNNIIAQKRNEKKIDDTTDSEDGVKRKVALLNMLLESENKNLLSNEDLREEIDTFMFEGHDTTASGLDFAILALANNQDIQDNVYQEVKQVLGDEPNVTMHHLQEVKYTEMVIKEVQRMYPSVPFFERELESDFTIGDFTCPKGTVINIFSYGQHHDARYFPDPEKFDPDRFLPENQSQRHKFAYIPFSAGPRNCIGQKFAMLEMKATIMKIVRKFRILPVPNFKPDIGMAGILNSYNGLCVKLEKRC